MRYGICHWLVIGSFALTSLITRSVRVNLDADDMVVNEVAVVHWVA